jgi:hypothetical protein
MKLIVIFVASFIGCYLMRPTTKPVAVIANREFDFFCEPDSVIFIDGVESKTYKSKHFVNEVHLK